MHSTDHHDGDGSGVDGATDPATGERFRRYMDDAEDALAEQGEIAPPVSREVAVCAHDALARPQADEVEAIVARLKSLPGDRLLPVGELREIEANLKAAAAPCGLAAAARCAKVLIGSYPARHLHDPQVFAAAVVSVLSPFPERHVRAAIDKLTRSKRFLPTRAEVLEAVEAAAADLLAALAKACRQLDEHDWRETALEIFGPLVEGRARRVWEKRPAETRGEFRDHLIREALSEARYGGGAGWRAAWGRVPERHRLRRL